MASVNVTEYDPATGALLGAWTMEEEAAKEYLPHYVDGAYSALEFFIDVRASPPAVKPRPEQGTRQSKAAIAADGMDVVVFSGLPQPCVVDVRGMEYAVDDGVFEWGTHLAGDYPVKVTAFPYLDWEGAVTAG